LRLKLIQNIIIFVVKIIHDIRPSGVIIAKQGKAAMSGLANNKIVFSFGRSGRPNSQKMFLRHILVMDEYVHLSPPG
jgi:hypothetical protein